MPRAWSHALFGDLLDQPSDQRQALSMVMRELGVRRLTARRHVADHGDWTARRPLALDAPSDDGCIVHGTVEREIHLDVPLERIELGRGTRDARRVVGRSRQAASVLGLIDHVVGERVPVPRRRLRAWAVRPELGQHTAKITARHEVWRVRCARRWIQRVPRAVVHAEGVVAVAPGRDVERHARIDVKLCLALDHLHHPVAHLGIDRTLRRRILEHGWLYAEIPDHLGPSPLEREGRHLAPVRSDVGLETRRQDETILRGRLRQIELLPLARKGHARAGDVEHERRIFGDEVGGVGVAIGFVGTVLARRLDHALGDAISHGPRRVALGVGDARIVAEHVHEALEAGLRHGGADGERRPVAMLEHPEGCIGDGLAPRRLHIARGMAQAIKLAERHLVVSSPGVVHGCRHVVEVSRVHARLRDLAPNRVQELLVPAPRDGAVRLWIDRVIGTRRGRRHAAIDTRVVAAFAVARHVAAEVNQHAMIEARGEHTATDGPHAAIRIDPGGVQRLDRRAKRKPRVHGFPALALAAQHRATLPAGPGGAVGPDHGALDQGRALGRMVTELTRLALQQYTLRFTAYEDHIVAAAGDGEQRGVAQRFGHGLDLEGPPLARAQDHAGRTHHPHAALTVAPHLEQARHIGRIRLALDVEREQRNVSRQGQLAKRRPVVVPDEATAVCAASDGVHVIRRRAPQTEHRVLTETRRGHPFEARAVPAQHGAAGPAHHRGLVGEHVNPPQVPAMSRVVALPRPAIVVHDEGPSAVIGAHGPDVVRRRPAHRQQGRVELFGHEQPLSRFALTLRSSAT